VNFYSFLSFYRVFNSPVLAHVGHYQFLSISLSLGVNIMLNFGRLRHGRSILPRRTFSTSSAEASAKSKPPSKTDVAGIAVFGSICLGTFGLGCWQLQRYNWKVDLMDEAKKRYSMDAQVIGDRKFSQSEMYDSLQDISGQRLALKGTFDHDNEVRIGPRAAPPGLVTDAAQGMATNPQGFFVITPFRTSQGAVVFVNRGWVKRGVTDINRPHGVVTLDNLIVSAPEKANRFNPAIDKKAIKEKQLIWVEADALVEAGGLAGVILEGDGVPVVEVVEVDGTPLAASYPVARRFAHVSEPTVTPLTHLTYAFTWFSLAAAGTAMTYYQFRRGRGRIGRKNEAP
jgi:surfeit locus 1 family protein